MLFFTVTSCVISTSTWKRHFGDKSGPQLNMHPVSKRWICVVGTEDCLVLKNHLHWRRKGNMLRCLAFRWLGESQTFYKKSGVCVCTWSEFTPLKCGVQPQQDMDMHLQFSQSVVYVGGISFYLGMWSLSSGCVLSKSLSYTVSLFRQFRCRLETASPTVLEYDLFIDMHIPVIVEA